MNIAVTLPPLLKSLWLYIITICVLIFLAGYSWKRRNMPGAKPFSVSAVFFAIWVVAAALGDITHDENLRFFWYEFKSFWQIPATTATLCFMYDYTWPNRWLTRRNLIFLSIVPVIYLGFLLTDPYHHYTRAFFDALYRSSPVPINPGWIFIFYNYLLFCVNLYSSYWLFRYSPQHRLPVVLLFIGQVWGRGLYVAQLLKLIQYNPTVEAAYILFFFLINALIFLRYRLLDDIAHTHQMVISQMHEGMLILDSQGRVIGLNLAAEKIFASKQPALGQSIQTLLPIELQVDKDLPADLIHRMEMKVRCGQDLRDFDLNLSALRDWRGLVAGWLLLLRDMTEQKRIQAQLMEQRQIRATLMERDRIARELHDTLVQTSVAIRIQAETAEMMLTKGEDDQVSSSLGKIADSAQQMHQDLREYIFKMRSRVLTERTLADTLREKLDQFSSEWAIPIELNIPVEMENGDLDALLDCGQIDAIIQEAISNIRKHAMAKHIRINFIIDAGILTLGIEDDGRGFDPQQVSGMPGNRFGLRSIYERAQDMDGEARIDSKPGQGTRVVVSAPLKIQPSGIE